MPRRIWIHVGTPKTGTSAFQNALFTRRQELPAAGFSYPGERFDAHFLAALELMDLPWGGLEHEAAGAWTRLVDEAGAANGEVIISHEIFGRASRLQVERALHDLGGNRRTEMHVVVTARDLARQIPAEWQESVKHRRTLSYDSFLKALTDPSRGREIAQWFWSVQEIPDILDRWGADLPPEQVHVVTLPPAGAPPALLSDRLAGLLGLDRALLAPTGERANASLGVAESETVRRLNELVRLSLPNERYRQFVREGLVHQNLGMHRESARLSVPPEVHAWASELSRGWVAQLRERGYDVVGDLDELLPTPAATPFVDPGAADPDQIAHAALKALAGSVGESARLRDVEIELHEIIDDLMRQLDDAHSTRVYKAKQRLVALAGSNGLARAGLSGYRRIRGKNSRST